jgi:MFS family permease
MAGETENNGKFILWLSALVAIFYLTVFILAAVSIKDSNGWGQKLINVLILSVLILGVVASAVAFSKMGLTGLIAFTGIGFIVSLIIAIISGIGRNTAEPGSGKTEDGWILALSLIVFVIIFLLYLYDIGQFTSLRVLLVIVLLIGSIVLSIQASNVKKGHTGAKILYITLAIVAWLALIAAGYMVYYYKKKSNKESLELLDKKVV